MGRQLGPTTNRRVGLTAEAPGAGLEYPMCRIGSSAQDAQEFDQRLRSLALRNRMRNDAALLLSLLYFLFIRKRRRRSDRWHIRLRSHAGYALKCCLAREVALSSSVFPRVEVRCLCATMASMFELLRICVSHGDSVLPHNHLPVQRKNATRIVA